MQDDDPNHKSTTPTAEEYRRLAEAAYGAAMSTLNPKAASAFYIAARNYLAQAKALDPTIPDLQTRGPAA